MNGVWNVCPEGVQEFGGCISFFGINIFVKLHSELADPNQLYFVGVGVVFVLILSQ